MDECVRVVGVFELASSRVQISGAFAHGRLDDARPGALPSGRHGNVIWLWCERRSVNMVSGWRRTGQCTGQKGFDADHVNPGADGAIAQGLSSELLVAVAVVFRRVGYFFRAHVDAEQPAAVGRRAARWQLVSRP